MNLAFPAVVLVILVWPGILLRGVTTANLPRQSRTLVDRVFDSLAAAGSLHLVWVSGLYVLGWTMGGFEWQVDLEHLVALLMGKGDPVQFAHSIGPILWYFGSQSLAVVALGFWLRQHLMRANSSLGRLLQWAFQVQIEWILLWSKPDVAVYLSAIVATESQTFLYHGMVVDVFWNRHGEVQAVALFDATRRPLERDRRDESTLSDERFYRIVGDRLLINYDDMITVNFTYIRVRIPGASAPIGRRIRDFFG